MGTVIPESMLACQVVEFNRPYVLRTVPVPGPQSLGSYDLLLKTAVASLCHTDSMVIEGRMTGTKLPITGSHEGTGVVVAKGSAVSDFAVGDRVLAGIPRNRCGECDDCASSDTQYCSNRQGGIGLQVDGAFAEYVLVDSRDASVIPDGLDFVSAAPLACAGITVWRALEQTRLVDSQWLGVIGSGGGLGHLAIQFAKKKGLKVVGVDARDEGVELSAKAGADLVQDARRGQEAVVHEIIEATGGKGVGATINLSEAKSAASLGCAITAKHGRLVQVAQPPEVVIPFRELVFRDITVKGSLTGSAKQTQEMLHFVAKHGIHVETNIYHGLSEVSRMVIDAHSGRLKGKSVVIVDNTLA
ncbi:alcohol dehydrogenase [Rhizodiscina lignyota]|uniref:Alcohol dehydrogenase n=1 Tax=Rhizodiscina lignyota TaxID=1504668 RepID=A0A9P4IKG4_9PEZI|nr:alcohol dehydrogenase [Rhizodiscina lignyota]